MIWEYKGRDEIKTCKKLHLGQPIPNYVTCVLSKLPRINKAIIKFDWNRIEGFTLKDPKNQIKTEYEPQDEFILGMQLPCQGDSGSPHWIVNDEGEAVLVGIVTTQHGHCGYVSHMQRTIDSNIFDFIWMYGVNGV